MLLKLMDGCAQFRQVLEALGRRFAMPIFAAGLSGAHRAMLACAVAERAGRPILFITPDEASAIRAAEDMNQFLGEGAALFYPARDFNFRSAEGASAEYEHQRLAVLGSVLNGSCRAVTASAEAALQYTIPPGIYSSNTIVLKKGASEDLAKLALRFVRAGYERREEVDGICQFSIRGGILDFYSPQAAAPTRAEFWGDEIDSLARFDIESQRRTRELDSAVIAPAREVLPDSPEHLRAILLEQKILQKGKQGVAVKKQLDADLLRLEGGLSAAAPDRYLPLIYKFPATLFDYFEGAAVFAAEFIRQKETLKTLAGQWNMDAAMLYEEGILFPGCDKFGLDFEEYCSVLESSDTVLMDVFLRSIQELPIRTVVDFAGIQLSLWSGELSLLLDDVRDYLLREYTVAILAGTERGAKALAADLAANGIEAICAEDAFVKKSQVFVLKGALSAGMDYPTARIAVISHAGGAEGAGRRQRKVRKLKNPLRSLDDLAPGDYIVHVNHGIGVYEGIVKQEIRGVVKDYISIRYAGTDRLYVPVTQLDLVSKYIGAGEDKAVRLSKLNSAEWQKTRSRVKAAVKDMAKELIALYSKRTHTPGYAFGADTDWQRDFEERFPYEETEDQLRCIGEIKRDMEEPRPMDRLLCGDVGFGKTEVAIRAAFKAVMDGKQVAVLVPTTILSWQHYQTFLQRAEGFPITVELLSRFRTAKQQADILRRLRTGEIDILIGTHRILQKDVIFKDLGLCVIDEEQRFGVAHKERFKELKTSVDVLTLSATPIPRTLNMAMSGIRDMSTIEEAPQDRYPVQTYVVEYDRGLALEAIKKELRRGGQVFYLHNNIDDISGCAAKLQQDLPDARVVFAHGRMAEEELSEIWRSLVDQEVDILVSTTIIENGVDVPNCNTLIVENADRLGLAQLYQLRGRVGRSNRRAFAWFTFVPGKAITEIAQKRLAAIRDFTQFGSGVKIAMRDLEIRGAGNILGASQHGHMEAVGYDLYVRLLSEAVAEEKGEPLPPEAEECAVDIALDAHIPENYIYSVNQRIDVYKRIAAIRSEEDARDVIDELIDRFGDPPDAVLGLIEVATLRNLASALGITDISQKETELHFYPREMDLERVSMASGRLGGRLTMNFVSAKPHLVFRMKQGEQPVLTMKKVLSSMRYDAEK
ncbi:MAG TPA: transcription-repair coupling factor [Oscillospiraceae bacterium]|nr:transcription-repair coupling factor [Oscillospiraceae bacterium]HNW04653.1 transcription-repair coupling factor [Oscillospiraceae bacterium]